MQKPLTAQQENVLAFVEQSSRECGYPPTLREIGDALDLPNLNAVRGHLAALEKKGYIVRAPEKARSIQVVDSPSALSRVKRKLHEIFRTDEGVLHLVVYGLVWTTWKRHPLLTGARQEWVSEAMEREAVEHGWEMLKKKVEADHVVIVVRVWPNHSARQTLHRFRSAAESAKRRHRKEFPAGPLWGRECAVTTDLDLLDEMIAGLLGGEAGAMEPKS